MDRFEQKLNNPQAALKQIGALVVSESQRAFKLQKHGANQWRERNSPNRFGILSDFAAGKRKPPNRRFETRPALMDTGRLSKSIAFKLIGSKLVEIGTNLPYADVHHTGGEVESVPITKQMQQLMFDWLMKQSDEMFEIFGPLLERKMIGKTIKAEVPARPFIGITKQTIADVKEVVGATLLEVK